MMIRQACVRRRRRDGRAIFPLLGRRRPLQAPARCRPGHRVPSGARGHPSLRAERWSQFAVHHRVSPERLPVLSQAHRRTRAGRESAGLGVRSPCDSASSCWSELATHGSLSRRFEAIYVLDGPVKGAGYPRASLRRDRPVEPFGAELESALLERLNDLPPVRFIPRRSSVLTEVGDVRKNGVLVTVGPIDRDQQRARLDGNQWVGGKGAVWIKYVVP